jgi:hypothetical protein
MPAFGLAVPRSAFAVHLAPECQRLHGIIKCVVSADKMPSPPSKMIPSSINNLSIWYSERAPISYRLHLFGRPSHSRLSHNFHFYNTLHSAFTLVLFCPTAIPSPYDQERPATASGLNQPLRTIKRHVEFMNRTRAAQRHQFEILTGRIEVSQGRQYRARQCRGRPNDRPFDPWWESARLDARVVKTSCHRGQSKTEEFGTLKRHAVLDWALISWLSLLTTTILPLNE